MGLLEYVGATTIGLIGLFLAILVLHIAGNIYGGIRGAYRLRAILARGGRKASGHWPTLRLGLRAWTGERFDGEVGSYWRVGGLIVPVDGRDPIARDRFYGA